MDLVITGHQARTSPLISASVSTRRKPLRLDRQKNQIQVPIGTDPYRDLRQQQYVSFCDGLGLAAKAKDNEVLDLRH
jgi:hypothetical protein